MKLAITLQNGEVFQHFGHSKAFKIYSIENNRVVSSEEVPTNGSGHGALAGFLEKKGVEALICGGIGGGAKTALAEAGIKVYGGVSGNADERAAEFVSGNLQYNPDVSCSHHESEHSGSGSNGHNCSHEHTCSSGHSCHS